MFKKLSRRIINLTMLSVFISMLIVSLSLYFFEKKIIKDNFVKMASSYFESVNNNVIYYLNYVKENGKMILNTSYVSALLDGNEFVPGADSVLANMMSTNAASKTIAVFSNNGYKYSYQKEYSAAISELIDDNTLRNQIIRSSRSDFNYVKDKYGKSLLLLLNRVGDNNTIKGSMFLGLNLTDVLRAYDCEQTVYKGSIVYILIDNESVEPTINNYKDETISTEYLNMIKRSYNGNILTQDNKALIIYNTIPDSNMKIIVSVPLKIMNSNLNKLILMNVAFVIVCSLLCLWMAAVLKKSIINPLLHLHNKMKSFVK